MNVSTIVRPVRDEGLQEEQGNDSTPFVLSATNGSRANREMTPPPFVLSVAERQRSEVEGRHFPYSGRTNSTRSAGSSSGKRSQDSPSSWETRMSPLPFWDASLERPRETAPRPA